MYIMRITTKVGDKTKFGKWVRETKATRGRYNPKRETLTQTRARNAREYKRYFGRALTYPGFGRGFTYLGAHKVFL